MKSREYRGSLYAILSGLLYGFIGYFGLSAINGNLSASNMLFWRFLISSIIISLMLLPQLRRINDSYMQMFGAFLSGVFYYGISTLLYFYASHYLGSGLSMVIFFTYPMIIMVLNYFLYGQLIPNSYYLAIVILLTGMLLLVDINEIAFDVTGICLGLASALFYAGYIMFSKKSSLSPNVSTLMVSLGCMMTSLLVALFSNTFTVPDSMDVWLNLFGIGIVATVLPILLMLHSLKYISSEKASILSVLEPVFVVILGVLLLDERLEFWSALGIICVLTGALITLFSNKVENSEPFLAE